MTTEQKSENPPGWVGGFPQTNPDFAYPEPDLSAIPYYDNMVNLSKLERQQKVMWPEFSWLTKKDEPNPKRCFQMFAPDISRLGYTNRGRIYSIICPQRGSCSPTIGSMNIEVKVTANRGWANEETREMAADMAVVGKIWFSPSAHQNPLVKYLWDLFENSSRPFPFCKENAIDVTTHLPGDPKQQFFPLRRGETKEFEVPEFAKHPEAWAVSHLSVQVGDISKTADPMVDDFNEIIISIFNLASGNLLQKGNILSWNVWFTAPELVDQEEWAAHAEKWRKSIQADHGTPEGPGSVPRYFDGTPFNPLAEIGEDLIEAEMKAIQTFIKRHVGEPDPELHGILSKIKKEAVRIRAQIGRNTSDETV